MSDALDNEEIGEATAGTFYADLNSLLSIWKTYKLKKDDLKLFDELMHLELRKRKMELKLAMVEDELQYTIVKKRLAEKKTTRPSTNIAPFKKK